MLLAVDVGNTHVVVGLFAGERLDRSWRISTRRQATADEFGVLLVGLLGDAADEVTAGIVSSVVPPLTGQVFEALARLTGREPLVVAPGVKTGLEIRTDNPQEVGADRIINAVAAHARHGGPLVVVDFGTATTLDVVTADGAYLGGIIAPGPHIGAEVLSERAARLPRVDLTIPRRVIGRNTLDSIRSGLLYGHVELVDGLVRRVEAELGESVRVVATGGLATLIGPHLGRLDATDDDLTLFGLRLVHERNRPG
ncbi:MAG: type III pantothenate kinase [Acidobacteriota bacterium]|nr:type III pantothenate kinase [Acidobacteriota bacterium]